MANKFVDWTVTIILLLVLAAVVLGVAWAIIDPIVVWTDKSEFRIYVRLALLFLAIIAFGVLRLYNSIVQNTRFLVKLRGILGKLFETLPTLERTINSLTQKNDALRGTVTSNTRAVSGLSEDAKALLTTLQHNGTLKNTH